MAGCYCRDRQHGELSRVKRLDEPCSDEVRARITGIMPQDYTRMGVTIRHLTKLLVKFETRTKLLITLSDGKPDDYDGYCGEYGIEDTRMSLIEAKRAAFIRSASPSTRPRATTCRTCTGR